MRKVFSKRVNEESWNTHKIYQLSEFIFEENARMDMTDKLKSYRDEFAIGSKGAMIVPDEGMMLYILPLLNELKYYYNNDLCISISECNSISRTERFNLRTHAYYFENALFRAACAWEYLFIILNEYFQTNLVVGLDIRKNIIDTGCNQIDFIKSGNGYKIKFIPLDDEIKKEKEIELKKKIKLFRISQRNKSNSFLKEMKKQYSKNDKIQQLFDLYNCKEVKEIIDLRNEVVHRRPLSAKFSVGPSEIFPGQGVDLKPKGWYDIEGLPEKLEKNIYAIRDAIIIIHEMLFYNEVPNTKENENKTFYAYQVKCNCCNKIFALNQVIVDILQKNNEKLICPHCKGNDTSVHEKIEVNDRYFFKNMLEYQKFILDIWAEDT